MARHCIAWEFRVARAQRAAFEHAHGPQGSWGALFRRAPGYRHTDLPHDHDDPARHLGIDVGRSRRHHRDFLERFASEYAEFDRACEALTGRERALAEFTVPGSPQEQEPRP